MTDVPADNISTIDKYLTEHPFKNDSRFPLTQKKEGTSGFAVTQKQQNLITAL